MAWTKSPSFESLSRYGWQWCPDTTVDENFLDLAYLTARNSSCKDGHMGCVMVRGISLGAGGDYTNEMSYDIVLCTINSPLFGAYRSDCHAEANAVASCAARGVATSGLSCYITRSPCVACYKLLASAGIGRIIMPQPMTSPDCEASAAALGIECRVVVDTEPRALWRERLGGANEDMDRVRELRAERKRLRKERSFGKKTIREDTGFPAVCTLDTEVS
eukprot:CAMPEP_0119303718 /NCGR_PEP_ID=MMETSP1333-20130426/5104_1 /TAXON_ID=418940 /ORGANISM="Scyphosphaera apsteinii, Strain RCC1455" /LENGTH=218 /DNA_ID=CAMNT_0007306459 /DNA_START=218 /DNA_END=874 /DNA_ORIENTATION=-